MWRNYLTVGLRALVKNKTYAFINIFGLGVGLAACLMLLLYVRYETSYDAWLPNAENSYQFQSHYRDRQTGEENRLQMTSYVAGQRLKADFPQVDRIVYVGSSGPVIMRGGEALQTEDALLVDNLFFDVLQFPLVHGDRSLGVLLIADTNPLVRDDMVSSRLDRIASQLALALGSASAYREETEVSASLRELNRILLRVCTRQHE